MMEKTTIPDRDIISVAAALTADLLASQHVTDPAIAARGFFRVLDALVEENKAREKGGGQ